MDREGAVFYQMAIYHKCKLNTKLGKAARKGVCSTTESYATNVGKYEAGKRWTEKGLCSTKGPYTTNVRFVSPLCYFMLKKVQTFLIQIRILLTTEGHYTGGHVGVFSDQFIYRTRHRDTHSKEHMVVPRPEL